MWGLILVLEVAVEDASFDVGFDSRPHLEQQFVIGHHVNLSMKCQVKLMELLHVSRIDSCGHVLINGAYFNHFGGTASGHGEFYSKLLKDAPQTVSIQND